LLFNAEAAEGNGEDAEEGRSSNERQLRAERDSLPRSERGFKGARR